MKIFAVMYITIFPANKPPIAATNALAQPLDIDDDTAALSLTPFLEYYIDPEGKSGFDSLLKGGYKFQKNRQKIPAFGFIRGAVWARVSLMNRSDSEQHLIVYLKYPLIENLDFYLPEPAGSWKKTSLGLRENTGRDRLIMPEPSVNITIPANENYIFYLRAASPNNPIELPVYLFNELSYIEYTQKMILFHGIFYGIFIIMFFYNLFIYFILKDKTYLIYSLYIATTLFALASNHGRTRDFFGESFTFYYNTMALFTAFAPIFAIKFATRFLQLNKNAPSLGKVLRFNICLFIIYIITAPFINQFPPILYFIALTGASITLLIAGIRLYTRFPYARIYTHAWAVYNILLVIFSLRSVNIHFFFSSYAPEAGSLIEIILLSIALANRITYLQQEKRKYRMVQKDLALAREVQKYLFPPSAYIHPGKTINHRDHFKIHATYIPSASLSGDFYDYIVDAKGILHLIIVDVAGHGYAAGLLGSMIKVAFHETMRSNQKTSRHLEEINRILCNTTRDTFATAMLLRVNPARKNFIIARAGHMPLYHFQQEKNRLATHAPEGLPLGITDDVIYREVSIRYHSGDRIFLFTDGLTEETSPDGEEFGEERLQKTILGQITLPAEQLSKTLIRMIEDWKGEQNQHDDITFQIIDL